MCSQYVWILALPSLISHAKDRLDNQNDLSPAQQDRVRQALTGTLLIRPYEGDFTLGSTNKLRLAIYLEDAIMLHARAAQDVLEKQAHSSGMNISQLKLSRNNYDSITSGLLSCRFMGSSGEVKFDDKCHRISNTYTVLNYLPLTYKGENMGRISRHFIVERRAKVVVTTNDSDVIFYNVSNGTLNMIKDRTIVFRNGKIGNLSDSLPREYFRSKEW